MISLTASLPLQAATPTATQLDHLRSGSRARIRRICAEGACGERLLEMGLTAGTEIEVLRRGLWGGTVQLAVRGYVLSIGAAVAAGIEVLPLG